MNGVLGSRLTDKALEDMRRAQAAAMVVSPSVAVRMGALIRELEWKAKQAVALSEGES